MYWGRTAFQCFYCVSRCNRPTIEEQGKQRINIVSKKGNGLNLRHRNDGSIDKPLLQNIYVTPVGFKTQQHKSKKIPATLLQRGLAIKLSKLYYFRFFHIHEFDFLLIVQFHQNDGIF